MSGQPFSVSLQDNEVTPKPKIVDIFNKIPTDTTNEDKKDEIVVQVSSTSTLSPNELFSLIPRINEDDEDANDESETATVKLGDFVIPVSTIGPFVTPESERSSINLSTRKLHPIFHVSSVRPHHVSTINPPRVPPLRTTPGNLKELNVLMSHESCLHREH